MEIHTIKTEEDYEKALSVIDMLLSAPSGSEEAERLELVSLYQWKTMKINTILDN